MTGQKCQCGEDAVEVFPQFAVDCTTDKTISKPYCSKCLEKMRKELAENLMKNGRLN